MKSNYNEGFKTFMNNSGLLSLYGTSTKEYNSLKKEMSPRIGDYVVVYFNQRNFRGSVRGVNPSGLYNGGNSVLKGRYYMNLVSENSINRKWIQINKSGMIDNTVASYKIYKITGKKYTIQGLYSDNWSAKEVIIKKYKNSMNTKIKIGDMICRWNGITSNTLRFYVNDKLVNTININGTEKLIDLNNIVGKINTDDIIKIKVDKTDCPKNYGMNDNRELGVQMTFCD